MNNSYKDIVRALIYALGIVIIVTAGAVTLYTRSEMALKESLQDQLRTNATLAAMQFDAEEIAHIHDESDMGSPLFSDLVARAKEIQMNLDHVTYVYIMRRTEDPMQLAFVIEDDMLDTVEELDENGNGVIDDEEAVVVPGELFDISDVPAMQGEAFEMPTTDPEVTIDQWGSWMSGYAPIRNTHGETVAILGIDMSAEEYIASAQSIFSPGGLMMTVFAALLIALMFIALLWQRRLRLLQAIDKRRQAFIATASHKLGSPIATLRWWSEILSNPDEETCPDEAKQEIGTALNRLNAIAENLNDAINVEGLTDEEVRKKMLEETKA